MLSILDAERAHYTVRYYLQQPPTVGELREVLHRLNLDPWQITRLGEPAAADLGMTGWPRDEASRDRWVEA